MAKMAEALGTALSRVFDAQAHQIEQSSHFLDQLQDLSAKKAAALMGQRGGRVTAARKRAAAAAAPKTAACPLCENPMMRGVTVDLINEHRRHEASGLENVIAHRAEAAMEERNNGNTGNSGLPS